MTKAEVWTSQWCRCRETARLLHLGEAKDLRRENNNDGIRFVVVARVRVDA
ncbi:MAG: hypothetical protein JJU05_09255 [Verrucomicrobia bacterium]|nr:hypothetical protein [Verrucomicrobiota bacterium]MCH8527603.1 hypothetical protein [Kiritimatiellia bacterium]